MRKKVFIQSLRWFLPILFITFISGKVFFIHSHLENDSIVVHSHPFNKSDNTTHNHTAKEIIAIELHTHGHSTDVIVPHIEINSPLQCLVHHNYSFEYKIHLAEETNSNLLRAPPFHL